MPCPLTLINTLRRDGFPIPPALLQAQREYTRKSKHKTRKVLKVLRAIRKGGFSFIGPEHLRFDYRVQTVGFG